MMKKSCHFLFDPVWYKSWYSINLYSVKSLQSYFLEKGIQSGHNPSAFVNLNWLKRRLTNTDIKDFIFNPCSFVDIDSHPLIEGRISKEYLEFKNTLHHPSLNLNNWITKDSYIKHNLFRDKKAVLSPLEFQNNSIKDFYPIAGNCLENDERLIFDYGNWDLRFLINHLKYKIN